MMNKLSAKRILSTASVMVLNCDATAYEDAIQLAIEALSAERPKGRWEVIGKTKSGANILQCSNCKRIRRGSIKSAFCRDCGADMRGEEE